MYTLAIRVTAIGNDTLTGCKLEKILKTKSSLYALLFFVSGCQSISGFLNPKHPTPKIAPTTKKKSSQADKSPVTHSDKLGKSMKELPLKKEKSSRDSDNHDILKIVFAELGVKKNISVNMAGSGLNKEVCFVKLDTLESQLNTEKLEVTISEMIQGKEVANRFSLFASAHNQFESSEIRNSLIKKDHIMLEQTETDKDGFQQIKKLTINMLDERKNGMFVIEKPEEKLNKTCIASMPGNGIL